MDQNMNVNRAEMAKGAKQVEEHSQRIHQIQANLDGQIKDLMVKWTGNAATAFLRAYEGFYDKFRVVNQQLDRIHAELTETQKQYTEKEAEHEASTRSIDSLLNEH